MRIPVRPYFVSSLDHHTHLLRKGFERMPGDKPRRLEVVLIKEFQQARCTNLTCEEAAGNVVWGIFSAIGPEPSRHGIDIDAIGHLNFFLCHNCSLMPESLSSWSAQANAATSRSTPVRNVAGDAAKQSRRKPSPPAPNALPGARPTCASSTSRLARAKLSGSPSTWKNR